MPFLRLPKNFNIYLSSIERFNVLIRARRYETGGEYWVSRTGVLGPYAFLSLGEDLGVLDQIDIMIFDKSLETLELARRLKGFGVDRLQGFHFGRPVPFQDVRALLNTKGLLQTG